MKLQVIKETSLGRKLGKPQTSLEIIGDLLIVSTEDGRGNAGRIHALDIDTLEERWHYDVPSGRVVPFPLSIPDRDLIILAPFNMNGNYGPNALIALNAHTGNEEWTYPVNDSEDIYLPAYHPHGYLMCITKTLRVFCLDVKPNVPKKLWESHIPLENKSLLSLRNCTFHGGFFWVSTPQKFFCYSIKSKEPYRVYDLPPVHKKTSSSIEIYNGHIHLATDDGFALAISCETGDVLFETKLGVRIDTGPLCYGQKILYGGKNDFNSYELWVLDSSTGVVQQNEILFLAGEYGQFFAPLAQYKNWIVVQYGTDGGTCVVFDAQTGQHVVVINFLAPLYARPVFTTDALFAADRKGNIKKIQLRETSLVKPKRIHEIMVNHFSLSDLKNLGLTCLDISVDHLAGETVPDRATEMIEYAKRKGKLQDLITGLLAHRPDLQQEFR